MTQTKITHITETITVYKSFIYCSCYDNHVFVIILDCILPILLNLMQVCEISLMSQIISRPHRQCPATPCGVATPTLGAPGLNHNHGIWKLLWFGHICDFFLPGGHTGIPMAEFVDFVIPWCAQWLCLSSHFSAVLMHSYSVYLFQNSVQASSFSVCLFCSSTCWIVMDVCTSWPLLACHHTYQRLVSVVY